MLEELRYEFIDDLEYDYKGEKEIAESLVIQAPSHKLRIYTGTIEAAYLKSSQEASFKAQAALSEERFDKMMKLANSKKEAIDEDEDNQTAVQIVNAIMANNDSKTVNAVYDALEILLKESAKVDGHTKFGSALYDKLSSRDAKNILGEYINNFFIVSPQA